MERELDPSRELEEHERSKVWAWAAAEVPAGFAERVTMAWMDERVRTDDLAIEHQRWRTWSVAGVVALAAVLAALWLSGGLRAAAMDADAQHIVTAEAPADLAKLRDEVRNMLGRHCTPCHDAGSNDAKSGAISVFEVGDRAWADGLTEQQIGGVRDRLLAKKLEPREVARVEAFVERELAWRG